MIGADAHGESLAPAVEPPSDGRIHPQVQAAPIAHIDRLAASFDDANPCTRLRHGKQMPMD